MRHISDIERRSLTQKLKALYPHIYFVEDVTWFEATELTVYILFERDTDGLRNMQETTLAAALHLFTSAGHEPDEINPYTVTLSKKLNRAE